MKKTNTDLDIVKVASYYEIKGSFAIETRKDNSSLRPIILISSRFTKIIMYISSVLKEYCISHSVIKRKTFYTLRISSAKACDKFFNTFDNYINYKDDRYTSTYSLTKTMTLKDKDERKLLLENIKTRLKNDNR